MQPDTCFQNQTVLRRKVLGLSIVIVCILIGTQACSFGSPVEPPGEGEKAERGYKICTPVIHALEAYKQANDTYPSSLARLTPDYLPQVPTEVNNEPIKYEVTASSYQLSFGYTGPGINICTYAPEKDWHCSGLY